MTGGDKYDEAAREHLSSDLWAWEAPDEEKVTSLAALLREVERETLERAARHFDADALAGKWIAREICALKGGAK